MPHPLKVLVAEDNAVDAELVIRQLKRADFAPEVRRASTEPEFLAGLEGPLDIILSDYEMGDFNGLRALDLVGQHAPDVPFILVSGTIGEDLAVEAIKKGAADYLLKDRLTRLGAAVTHALAESRSRRERKRADIALAHSESRYRLLVEQAADGIFTVNQEGVYTDVNARGVQMLGYTKEEFLKRSMGSLIAPDDRWRLAVELANLRSGQASVSEWQIQRKDGSWFDAEISARAMPDGQLLGIVRDLTARKHAEQALRESERFVRAALNGLTAHVAILDEEGKILAVNEAWRLFAQENGGLHERGAEGSNYLDACDKTGGGTPGNAGRIAAAIRAILRGEQTFYEAEYPCHSDHEQCWFVVRITPFSGSGPKRVIIAHENVTARKIQEEALRASEERFRQIAENIHEVFWMVNPSDGRVLYVSPAYEQLWGASCESLYANPGSWTLAIHPDDRARVAAAASEKASGSYNETFRVVRPDKSVRWVRDREFPISDANGVIYRIVGTAEDITDHRQLEEQLMRTQRLEAVGTLAGGVAHDLNNILTPTLMAAELIRQKMTDPHGLQLVDMIEQSMRRGSGIIRQMLVFSRGISGQRISVQPRHLLNEVATLIRETFPREINLETDVAKDLRPLVADATQVHQVLINLCVNARDAMPGGGTLTLTASNVVLGPAEVQAHSQARPGRHVAITVADTGCGIPQEIHARIFEPFFTTKEIGKGTGLGLSSVLGIVRGHGGFVTVASTPGAGSTFTVYLPAEENTSEPRVVEAISSGLPRGHGELVLVVDDEEVIRKVTRTLLEGYGYKVLLATQGQEAIALFDENPGAVKLVITDVMMPVMGGAELIRVLRQRVPDLPILASSGLLEADKRCELADLGVSEILSKPYGEKDLLEAVRRQLPAV